MAASVATLATMASADSLILDAQRIVPKLCLLIENFEVRPPVVGGAARLELERAQTVRHVLQRVHLPPNQPRLGPSGWLSSEARTHMDS